MANKYVIRFSKTGYVKYTSHLDLLRMFKRAFKKAELGLAYSQGFNPHPKMTAGLRTISVSQLARGL